MAIVFAVLVAALAGVACWILSRPMFGRLPRGERLRRVEASPNYAGGAFVNRVPKPHMVEGVSMPGLAWDFLFRKKERSRPAAPVPAVKTDLGALPGDGDVLVWFGHSGLFLRAGGKRFLVDPNFTRFSSPFTWRTYSFEGTDVYGFDDIPDVDFFLVTHDHFDHLNHETVVALKERVRTFVCGLGVGEHLEYWGAPPERIVEMDWGDTIELGDGVVLHALPTHHFSGRTLWRANPTLWLSFVLETPDRRVYLGGDSGDGAHFAEIGERFGGFDLALLENGQYDANWRYNHLHPEETARAAEDLRAARLMPIHAGRFVLANHPWDEPYRRLAAEAEGRAFTLVTPKIGEPVWLDDTERRWDRWWEDVEPNQEGESR